jgi:hypothetical protein
MYTTAPSEKLSSHAPRSPAARPSKPEVSLSGATGPTDHARLHPRASSGESRYLPSSARRVFDANPQLSRFLTKFWLTASPTCSSMPIRACRHWIASRRS